MSCKECERIITDIYKTHSDDKGHWIKDPKQTQINKVKRITKEIVSDAQELTINEVIERYLQDNLPRHARPGTLTAKTQHTFTRFLIKYLQKKTKSKVTEIPSPTFTIMYEYLVKKKLIHHYDFYRIESYKEINNIGIFEDKEVITLVEWPEKIKFKPKNRIELKFSYSKNFSCRKIKIKLCGNCKNYEI